MILGVDGGVVALVAVALVVGATVQGLVGLGLGLVSAPVVTLLDPSLMPELMLVLAAVLPCFTLIRSHDDIDWQGLAWVLSARVPGTAVGVPVRPTTLAVAGLVSGAAGTATSIGGPPVALLYQHRSPGQIRSTLAVLFTVGAVMSLIGIWLGGHFEVRLLLLALALTPSLALGAWAGDRLRGVFPDDRIRYAVLAVCAASAVALLLRSLLG